MSFVGACRERATLVAERARWRSVSTGRSRGCVGSSRSVAVWARRLRRRRGRGAKASEPHAKWVLAHLDSQPEIYIYELQAAPAELS